MHERLTWSHPRRDKLRSNFRVHRIFNEIASRGLLANALRKLYWAGALISARNML